MKTRYGQQMGHAASLIDAFYLCGKAGAFPQKHGLQDFRVLLREYLLQASLKLLPCQIQPLGRIPFFRIRHHCPVCVADQYDILGLVISSPVKLSRIGGSFRLL